MALKSLAGVPEVRARTTDARAVRQLWDVCRIPDFRGISHAEHAGLLEKIFGFLQEWGRVPDDWLARQVKRIDRTDGEIDTLSKRLAYIRTWTYVAQRAGWVDDETHWRGATRAVEDRLSDALHERLTQRFVDRRTSVLLRRLKQKESLVAEVNDKGEVTVEGQFVGRLEGFRFSQDKSASPDEAKTLRQASLQALKPEFHLRADRFYNAPDTELDFTDQGGLMWGEHAVGKLVAGSEPLKPQAEAFVDDEAGPEVQQKVQRRLQHFIDRKISTLFEPLLAVQRDEALTGLARGFAFRMVENLGVLPRDQVAGEVKDLDQDSRAALRKHGIRFGQFTVFMPLLLKPAPTRLRLVLWSLSQGLQEFPESPPPGLVTIPADTRAPEAYHTMAGYRAAGERAIRIDMLERLADMLRAEDSRGGFEATADMLSITGMTLEQFAKLMTGLGYRAERGEREKVKPVTEVIPEDQASAEEFITETGGTELAEPGTTEVDPATAGLPDADTPQPDVPVMDQGDAAPAGGVSNPEPTPPPAAEVPEPADEAQALDAEGVAPIDEVADNVQHVDDGIPQSVEEEILPGNAPDAEVAGPELEVYYTFTWAGLGRRREGGGKGRGRQGGGQDREGGGGGRQGKGKPKGKRPPKNAPQNRNFESRPPKKDRIDPDNPFAAALMGLKDKD
jgi:ATP-dependent RNA helicase SUPV3L1/SUV3